MTNADYSNVLVLFANTPIQAESLQRYREQEARGIGLYVNANKKIDDVLNTEGAISTITNKPLKTEDQFAYHGSSISSTESDVDIRLAKAWNAIGRLSIISKSDFTDKIKRDFFQVVAVPAPQNGCTDWTVTKHMVKKLEGNSTHIHARALAQSAGAVEYTVWTSAEG